MDTILIKIWRWNYKIPLDLQELAVRPMRISWCHCADPLTTLWSTTHRKRLDFPLEKFTFTKIRGTKGLPTSRAWLQTKRTSLILNTCDAASTIHMSTFYYAQSKIATFSCSSNPMALTRCFLSECTSRSHMYTPPPRSLQMTPDPCKKSDPYFGYINIDIIIIQYSTSQNKMYYAEKFKCIYESIIILQIQSKFCKMSAANPKNASSILTTRPKF